MTEQLRNEQVALELEQLRDVSAQLRQEHDRTVTLEQQLGQAETERAAVLEIERVLRNEVLPVTQALERKHTTIVALRRERDELLRGGPA